MDHLIKDNAPLELFAWRDPAAQSAGNDIFGGNPFNTPHPDDQFTTAQNYFAEYHLEYYRQRLYNDFPSRIHATLLFATRVDAKNFGLRHRTRVAGKALTKVRSCGDYIVSFHDSSWLDYLRLPHSLSLSTLDEISGHYWRGQLVEEIGVQFMSERWSEPPVIEALFQGTLNQEPPSLTSASQ